MQMSCRPLAVVIMHVYEYEISKKFKSGGINDKHAVATWGMGTILVFAFRHT
jgi:hypothetical protein